MKAGKKVKMQWYDHEEEQWIDIGESTCYPIIEPEGETGEWQEYLEQHGQSWSIECEIIDIDWDETWLVAYMARMYANEYQN